MMLATLFHDLNLQHFRGELPPPQLAWNSRLSSSAGRFIPGSRNPLFSRAPKIEVASYLRDIPEGEFHIRDTVLHEMVHYLLWHRRRPYGHTPEFHEILKRVGARRYNPVPKRRNFKHWYKCPGCAVVIPTRRLLKKSACLACCKKHSRGYYSDRFRLELTTEPLLSPTPHQSPAAPSDEPHPGSSPPQTISAEEVIGKLEALKRMLIRA